MVQYAVPSHLFIQSLKLHPEPAYRLAWRANVHPNTLSKLVSGYLRARVNDSRIIAVGRELGLQPAECFVTDTSPEPERTPAAARA